MEWKLDAAIQYLLNLVHLETFLSGMETHLKHDRDGEVGLLETFLSGMETQGVPLSHNIPRTLKPSLVEWKLDAGCSASGPARPLKPSLVEWKHVEGTSV